MYEISSVRVLAADAYYNINISIARARANRSVTKPTAAAARIVKS